MTARNGEYIPSRVDKPQGNLGMGFQQLRACKCCHVRRSSGQFHGNDDVCKQCRGAQWPAN